MPKHAFAKGQSKGHLIDQPFQRACRLAAAWKVGVRPCPKIAMPVSAIVSLHAGPQNLSRIAPPIERDLPGKHSVRVRCTRKTNPSLITERHAKRRAVAQFP